METSNYLTVIAYSFGAFIVLSLPFLVAAIATVSNKYDIPRKKLFVFFSGVFSYGLSGILAIILGPLEVLSTFMAPRLHLDGYGFFGSSLQGLSNILEIIVPLVAIIGSVLSGLSYSLPEQGFDRNAHFSTAVEDIEGP